MEITCPSCKKLNRSDPCQRCGCELESLFAIRRAAISELAHGLRFLEKKDFESAGDAAARSWQLLHTPEAARVGFLASMGTGDSAAALSWLQRESRAPAHGRVG